MNKVLTDPFARSIPWETRPSSSRIHPFQHIESHQHLAPIYICMLTMNLRPIDILSFNGTLLHFFCASLAAFTMSSSSFTEGYVRVTTGCWLCGEIVVCL